MKSLPLRAHEAAAYAASGETFQIRRVVKPQPVSSFGPLPSDAVAEEERPGLWSISSYGKGVRQYMGLTPFSRADGIEYFRRFCPYGAPGDRLALREGTQMPLSAVRWHPVITAVRLERVQDISEAEARACGFDGNCPVGYIPSHQSGPCVYHYAVQFDRDNPRTPWESNPWVWVIDVEGGKA